MILVICHKGNDTFVNLHYPTPAVARTARARAFRTAQEKRSRYVTFGPDIHGQDCVIHLDCLGSASIIEGGDEQRARLEAAKAKREAEAAHARGPVAIPHKETQEASAPDVTAEKPAEEPAKEARDV